jgi:hypothetical protein
MPRKIKEPHTILPTQLVVKRAQCLFHLLGSGIAQESDLETELAQCCGDILGVVDGVL